MSWINYVIICFQSCSRRCWNIFLTDLFEIINLYFRSAMKMKFSLKRSYVTTRVVFNLIGNFYSTYRNNSVREVLFEIKAFESCWWTQICCYGKIKPESGVASSPFCPFFCAFVRRDKETMNHMNNGDQMHASFAITVSC